MSSADISRDLVETLPLTKILRELLEIAKSQILQDVEAVKAGPMTKIPAPDVSGLVADEVQESYRSKMEPGSRLHTILDPQKLSARSPPTIFVLQEGICHIEAGYSGIILPVLKIGELGTRIITAPASANDVPLEPDGTLTAVAGKARVRSSGNGKLAYFIIAYKGSPPKPH